MTTFIRFFNNELELRLEKQSPLYELTNMKFKDLDKALQRKFKSSTLSIIVILKESNDMKYDIFQRLNQGAVSLKDQEILNCIYRGSFNNLIKDIVTEYNDELTAVFKSEHKRMNYEEQILKFFTMINYRNIKAPFYKAMNSYMQIHQNDSETELKKQKKLFLDTFRLVRQVLGDEAFSSYNSNDGRVIRAFNSPIYDSIMISFSSFRRNDVILHADEIREKIEWIKRNDSVYDSCIHTGTNSGIKTSTRIEIIYNAVKEILNVESESILDPRAFSEEQKRELFYDGCKCGICGQSILCIEDSEVDHIIPYSKGGRTIIENAQLVHSSCNRIKGNKILN